MARSPFQGTYQPNARPVVVTAPDAFVLINNSSQITGCPTCNKTFDINKYITSIQVDLSIDSVPGSASISLSVPRHTIDDVYFDGVPVISPMMEVNIYAKGFYLVQGLPQYYPIFWGLITSVNDSYSGGEHSISLHCADILKWWELCRMNQNPAYTSPVPSKFGVTLNGNVFAGANPFDVIWTLAQQAYGDIMSGGGSLLTLTADSPNQKPVFMAALSDIMAYWSQRFQNMSKNLLLFGSSGVCVRGDVLQEEMRNGTGNPRTLASRTLRTASGNIQGGQTGQMLYDPNDPGVVAFRTNNSNLGVNFWQNEYQTKLEIANAAKDAIGYEFFMDVTGDIVFKPPFYNLDILSNKPVSWIQDIDVIDWDLEESEAEVITQLTLSGNYSGNTDWGWPAEMTPFANVTDYHLLRKYGWRPAQLNSEFMGGDTVQMFYYGLDVLDRMNARRHHGTVTIPFRPEIRLGIPIYLASKDQIWYVQGVSHNIQFGGRATTSLTLTAKREKFKAPQGIGSIAMTSYSPSATTTSSKPSPGSSSFPYSGKQLSQGGSFTLKVGDAATIPPNPTDLTSGDPNNNPFQPLIIRDPQSGRILGYPNVVMAYLQPYFPSLATWVADSGQNANIGDRLKPPSTTYLQSIQTSQQRQQQQMVDDATSQLTDKHLTNRAWFGLTSAGAFVYAHDLGTSFASSNNVEGVIGELVLLPAGHLTTTPAPSGSTGTTAVNNATVMIRPVSDDRGFEVIGHYRYGRGVSLSDGQLVVTGGASSATAANVALQVALSGDLFAALTAQAQGLTAVSSPYANPIDAIAQLQPEDLRTSGFTTPNVDGTPGLGVPTYGNTATNFAALPVYGSPQQVGVFSSVEASQLSQGLTLAEMTVIDNTGSQDGTSATQPQCMCLLGRSDLAFINTGYQVSTIQATSPDNTSMFNPNQFAGVGPTVSPSIASMSPTQVQTVIDQFLFGLYTALDGPHQTYEQQLRGGIFQAPQPGENGQIQFGPTALGATAPPFSAASQFAAGNPLAAAQMASSAAANISQAWSSFGQNLQNTAQIASLSAQLSNDQSNLATLQQQLAQLQAGTSPGSVVVTLPPAAPPIDQINQLLSQIATLQQKIASESTQINQLQQQAGTGVITPITVPSAPFPAMGNNPGQGALG